MVKRSGAHTANPNEPTELMQFLVQRLCDYQDGKDLIPGRPLSSQEKKPWFWWVAVRVGCARALPLRAPMAQVEVLLAAAAEAVVRRLFPLGLLRGHYHLYPPPPHLSPC